MGSRVLVYVASAFILQNWWEDMHRDRFPFSYSLWFFTIFVSAGLLITQILSVKSQLIVCSKLQYFHENDVRRSVAEIDFPKIPDDFRDANMLQEDEIASEDCVE